MAWLIPWTFYAYPAAASLAATSVVPVVLGRYSRLLFAFNLWSVALIVLGVLAWRHGWQRRLAWAYWLLAATSVVVPFNGDVRHWPALAVVLPTVRLTAAVAAAALEFLRSKRLRSPARGWALAGAAMLTGVSLFDLALGLYATIGAATGTLDVPDKEFRHAYDLSSIGADDLVLVGDSYVWGSGVRAEDAFGERLAALVADSGRPGRVFSLGIRGASTDEYLRIAARIPATVRARRVLLALYPNDIEPVPDWRERLAGLCTALRDGCPTLGLAGDRIGQWMAPDGRADHAMLVGRYERSEPTYAARWQSFEARLREFFDAAQARSRERPLLVLLPLMVDFSEYPLEAVHRDVAEAAARIGFETVDLLPAFRERLGNGYDHWATERDNHFDAAAHALAAEALWEKLRDPPE